MTRRAKNVKTSSRSKKNESSGKAVFKGMLIIIAVVVGFAFIYSVFSSDGSSNVIPAYKWRQLEDGETACTNAYYCVIVDSAKTTGSFGFGKITGRIVNSTNRQATYVQIVIGLYAGENKVSSCMDNVNYLDAGATWNFSASCLDAGSADTYRVEEVTWW